MLLAPDVAGFVAWFAGFQSRVGDVVRSCLNTAIAPVAAWRSPADEAAFRLEIGGAVEVEWGQWLDASAHPELLGMRHATRRSLAQLEHEHPFAALADELREAVAELPESVLLFDGLTEPSAGEAAEREPTIETPLRRWFELELVDVIVPVFTTLEQTLVGALQDVAARIEEVERVLDYYTLAVQRHAAEFEQAEAEEFARTGLTRVQTLIEELHRRRAGWARRALSEFVDASSAVLEDASAPYRAHRPDQVRRRLDDHDRRTAEAAAAPSLARRARAWVERSYRIVLPFATQLRSELRALLHDDEPEAIHRAFRSLLASDPAELGGELPLSYRKLFAVVPIQIADLYIRRPALEDACIAAIESWRQGIPQTLLIHGDRGAGKRTLTNHVLARVRSQAALDVRWVRLGPNLRGEAGLARVLDRVLGCSGEPRSFVALARALVSDTRRRVIVLENAERLLDPSPAGVARMSEFLAMVGETATMTLWILLMATPAAALALHRLGFANQIPTILQVEPMSATELRTMISARHRLSGFELEFAEPPMHLLDRVSHPITSFRARAPSDTFHARLWRLTSGNPRQAMYYWLARARLHPEREGRIVMAPLPAAAIDLLPSLPLSQRLILALLAQHGSLTSDELVAALSGSHESVAGDLKVLWASGYLVPSRELQHHWTLRPTIAHPLLMELRSSNMI